MSAPSFAETFPELGTVSGWADMEVLSVRVRREERSMEVRLRARMCPDAESTASVRGALAGLFGLGEVDLHVESAPPAAEFLLREERDAFSDERGCDKAEDVSPENEADVRRADCLDEEAGDFFWLPLWIRETFPASSGYLAGAVFAKEGDVLVATLAHAAPKELMARWMAAAEAEMVVRGQRCRLRFAVPDEESRLRAEEAFLREKEALSQAAPSRSGGQGKTQTGAPRKAAEASDETGELLYGRAFAQKSAPMSALPREGGDVCVRGEVFAVERKELRTGSTLLLIDLTDKTGAARVKLLLRPGEPPPRLAEVKEGQWLCARGKLQPDRFSRDGQMVLEPSGVRSACPSVRLDTAGEKRVELHLHTSMSAMDALTDVERLFAQAKLWGHKAIAITDHGVLHAYPAVMSASKKTGVKALYGCEAYFSDDIDEQERAYSARQQGRARSHHMIVLVKNQAGLRNLYKLVSDAHVKDFYYHPVILRSKLDALRDGLILGSACEAGMLFRAIVDGAPPERLREVARYYDFLEIQPVCNNAFMLANGKAADWEALRALNRRVVDLGEELGIPVVATGDVHFLEPEDEQYRKILLASKEMDSTAPLPLYFKPTQEMLAEFAYLGEEKAHEVVVKNPNAVAEMCESVQPVRAGEYFPTLAGSADELRELSLTRAEELYGPALPSVLEERLNKELDAIIGKGYDVIYMSAQKLVQRSLEKGYLVGSRGSVGSSIVAYLAGITEINALPPHYRCPRCRQWEFPETPVTAVGKPAGCGADLPDRDCPHCGTRCVKDGFDTPFAIFMGFDADKKPDIDLNFSGEYQAQAHQHTLELFGADKVFRAGTISGVQDKTAVGYVRKYAEKEGLLLSALEESSLARGCSGVKRTTGQHPGGVIIVPGEYEIYDFCPVQRPADKRESDIITTHFDYHSIEENLLKLDLLGHDDPSMIRMLEEITGVAALEIPLDDPDTMSIFTDSAVLGYEDDPVLGVTGACALPEFGTGFVRGMLVATHPTTLHELICISGLSHGELVWRGNQEDLVKNGTATLGEIICSREDIIHPLIARGMDGKLACAIMESVRKGKGVKPEWESAMREAGVPDWYIGSCQKLKYLFPKAHAAAYVVMAFRIAWFKVHCPLAFYAAFFSIRAVGFDALMMTGGIGKINDKMAALRRKEDRTQKDDDLLVTLEVCYEFYRRGFTFLPVSLYESDAVRFHICGQALRPPLTTLPGLGETAAESILRTRDEGAFLSVEEIRIRCGGKVTGAHIDALRDIGALEGLPESAQLNLFELAE